MRVGLWPDLSSACKRQGETSIHWGLPQAGKEASQKHVLHTHEAVVDEETQAAHTRRHSLNPFKLHK